MRGDAGDETARPAGAAARQRRRRRRGPQRCHGLLSALRGDIQAAADLPRQVRWRGGHWEPRQERAPPRAFMRASSPKLTPRLTHHAREPEVLESRRSVTEGPCAPEGGEAGSQAGPSSYGGGGGGGGGHVLSAAAGQAIDEFFDFAAALQHSGGAGGTTAASSSDGVGGSVGGGGRGLLARLFGRKATAAPPRRGFDSGGGGDGGSGGGVQL